MILFSIFFVFFADVLSISFSEGIFLDPVSLFAQELIENAWLANGNFFISNKMSKYSKKNRTCDFYWIWRSWNVEVISDTYSEQISFGTYCVSLKSQSKQRVDFCSLFSVRNSVFYGLTSQKRSFRTVKCTKHVAKGHFLFLKLLSN